MYKAILLLGPTGSGKTPLGKHLEQHGLNGKRCWHFDFGANLRNILTAKSAKKNEVRFSKDEVEFIRSVLKSGALLEDKDFPLAKKILESFIARNGITKDDIIVLNGLPRHLGQAKAMAGFIDINMVVHLTAAPEVLYERIRTNAGGDRGGRTDDTIDDIRKKIAIFNERTKPLIDQYRGLGVEIVDILIGLKTTVAEAWQRIDKII